MAFVLLEKLRSIKSTVSPDLAGPHLGSLLRQLFARLLAHHVFGVPIWPVRVGLPDPFLVLPVGLRAANHCLGKIVYRSIGRVACNAPRKPLRHFLQQPAVAVRIAERCERIVAETLGVCPAHSRADAGKPASRSGFTMKYLARIDAVRHELLARNLNVGHGDEQALRRTGAADVRFTPN